jgi:hypothetical protein
MGDQLANLLAFARQGGLVIAAAYRGPSGIAPATKDFSFDYKMYSSSPANIVTLWVNQSARPAQLWSPIERFPRRS